MRLALLTIIFSGTALAQTPFTCILDAGVPPAVRAGGKTELVGDLTITCTGGTPTAAGAPVPLYTLKIRGQSLNYVPPQFIGALPATYTPINITSRQLASDGSSEALLLIDEPHSPTNPAIPLLVCGDTAAPVIAGVCAVTGTGSGAKTYNGTIGRPNVFQGKLIAADTMQWTGIPIAPPGLNNKRIIRITNVRMNANQAPLSASNFATTLLLYTTLTSATGAISFPVEPGSILEQISAPPGTVTVAFIEPELAVETSVPLAPMALQQCQANNSFLLTNPASAPASYTVWLRAREGFQSAFKRKNLATNGPTATDYPSTGDQNQNVPGTTYSTESGFENLGPAHEPVVNPPISANSSSGPGSGLVASTAAFPSVNGLINAGVADHGMRIAFNFLSVPSGVAVFVPTGIRLTNQLSGTSTGQAVLVATDIDAVGSPIASNGGSIANFDAPTTGLAQIPLTNGFGWAVYEILSTDPFSPEQFRVPVALSYLAGQPQIGITANVSVYSAPFVGSDLADASLPLPRFGQGGVVGERSNSQRIWQLFAFESCDSSAPKLTLTSSAGDTLYSTILTATVTPAPAAGGQVVYYLPPPYSTLGVRTLDANGLAQLSTSFVSFGQTVTATYTDPLLNLTLSKSTQAVVRSTVVLTPNNGSNSQTVAVGNVFAPLSVTVTDSTNKPLPNIPVTFGYSAFGLFSNGAGSITNQTDASGVAAATLGNFGTVYAGSHTIPVTAPGGNPVAFVFTTLPGPPASITADLGTTPQAVPINSPFYPLSFILADLYGNPISNVPVTFSAPLSGPGGSATNQTASTLNGRAALPFSANSIAGGPYTVTATVAGLPPVIFSLTNSPTGAPLVTTHPSFQQLFAGMPATFAAGATGQPTPTVRWQVSTRGGAFADIPNATATTLALSGISTTMDGNYYRAVFTNSLGYSNSNPAQLNVAPALPVITWNNPADIALGTALGATQLNATANVAGTFAYTPPSGTVLSRGSGQSLSVIFTPSDTANHYTVAATVSINVAAATAAPAVVSASPAASSGSTQTFAFQFSHPSGFANLNVLNILINTALDGRQGCYLAYVQPTNTLYLVNDAGDPAAPFAGGMVLNGTGSIANSQCTILGSGSSALGSGNQLTLTLNMTFSSTFAGNKVIYLAARDLASNNTGWQTMGVHGVPSTTTPTGPNPVSMSPSSGSGASQTLTFTYQDATSATNLQTTWALINTALDGRASCYIAYYRPGNLLLLIPDNGDGSQATSMALSGTTSTLSNSQCTISAQGSSASTSGAQLTLNLNVTFKSAFTGPKGVWMAVQNLAAQTSPWQALGVWRVP